MANPTERTFAIRMKLLKEVFHLLEDESKAHCISLFCAWLGVTELKTLVEHLKEKEK